MPTDERGVKPIEPEHIVSGNLKEIAIQTIPEKFYGAALAARFTEVKKQASVTPSSKKTALKDQKPRRSKAPIVILIIFLLAGVGGGFIYFNRELLFPTVPAPTVEPPKPEPPPVPIAPTDAAATSTSATTVQLMWSDASNNEAGFRVERREQATPYAPVTNLPPNATAFQDGGLNPSTTYLYRVFALNESGDSPASNEAVVATADEPPPPPAPPTLPPAGLDSDSDGLTDLEEPMYGSAVRDPDTDRDTFLDGNEVFHLYNPASGKNARLLESNLVKVLESPLGWRLYVPITWTASVSDDGRRGTISTGHGETFAFSVEENLEKLGIMDWYLAKFPGTISSQVTRKTTKSGFDGIVGVDPLTTYFPWGDSVFVFTYDLDGQSFVNFRTTYEMMQNSLSLSAVPIAPSVESVEPPAVFEESLPASPEASESPTASLSPVLSESSNSSLP